MILSFSSPVMSSIFVKAIEAHIPLLIIVTISSKVAAAMIAVGIPFALPYPLSNNETRQGTITEGDIQLNVYPNVYAIPYGI